MPTHNQGRAHAALLLTGRLTHRHGLTHEEAVQAIAHRQRNETGPHTHLVTMEAHAIVHEAMAPARAMMTALLAYAETAAASTATLARALQPLTTTSQTRPAWASPYGPPPRRTR